MRDWNLTFGDPLSLTLAADFRLTTPDYVNDHIWELELGTGEPASLSLNTTYGLRARSMRIFLRFQEAGSVVTDPKTFSVLPSLRRFYPNFITLDFSPLENLEANIEYWVPDSHSIAARLNIVNRTNATRQIKLEVCGILAPLDGQTLTPIQQQMVNILAGQTGGLVPVIFMTGGPKHGPGPHPSLLLELELGPGATRQITFSQASLDSIPASFELARHTAARPWEAERARIERTNESQTIDIRTGDTDWDAALAFSQKAALGLFMAGNDKLPQPSFVQARGIEHGFSHKGDGTDYPPSWNGQAPLESYYLANLLPGAPHIIKGLLQNFFSTQSENGSIDSRPGLNGNRSKFLAAPLLTSLAWKYYEDTHDIKFIEANFDKLIKFFSAWFSPAHDRDSDGAPEWDHVLQSCFEDNPIFDTWNPWSQGLDISLVHSPSLHAMLYREATYLIRMAEMLNRSEDLPLLHQGAEHVRTALHESWNARIGFYSYRDHETGLTSTGKVAAKRKGPGSIRPRMVFEAPTRLLIEIQTKSPAAKRPEVELGEYPIKGESELIEDHHFQWRSGGLVAVTKKIYARLGRVNIRGLDEKDKVIIKTIDTSGEDLTLALPLWAGIPDEQHAQVLLGRSLLDAERFNRPYGYPAIPLPPDPETDPVAMSVHLPWNVLIGEGLLKYGHRKEAARLMARIMNAILPNLKRNHAFAQRYHAEKGTPIGERNALQGLAPVGFFLQTLGITIYSPTRIRLEGENLYPWPVTISYKGLTILRGLNSTQVTFPNGKSVEITDSAACIVEI